MLPELTVSEKVGALPEITVSKQVVALPRFIVGEWVCYQDFIAILSSLFQQTRGGTNSKW